MPVDADLKTFASGKNFAALTTMGADGQPSTHMMWVDADDDHLIINTEVHRQKFKNLTRDPRATVTVIDVENPYRYIEARGHVVGTIGGDEARGTHRRGVAALPRLGLRRGDRQRAGQGADRRRPRAPQRLLSPIEVLPGESRCLNSIRGSADGVR